MSAAVQAGDVSGRLIAQSFRREGFLRVGLPAQLEHEIYATYNLAEEFFSSDLQRRIECGLGSGCGYRPYGQEHSGDPNRPDLLESFTASLRTVTDASLLPLQSARTLHQQMAKVIILMEPVAEKLAKALGEEISGGPIAADYRGGLSRWSVMQLNYAMNASADDFVNTSHEDGTLITIGHANAAGLEIADESGAYHAATCAADEAIVIPGESARLLSGGLIQPTYHRVRGGAMRQRISLLYFADLDPALCTPWHRSQVNEGVDIGQWIVSSPYRFGLENFEPD